MNSSSVSSETQRTQHRQFVPTTISFAPGDTFRISGWTWYLRKLETLGSSYRRRNHDASCLSFDTITECDRQMARQTDGHLYCSLLCYALVKSLSIQCGYESPWLTGFFSAPPVVYIAVYVHCTQHNSTCTAVICTARASLYWPVSKSCYHVRHRPRQSAPQRSRYSHSSSLWTGHTRCKQAGIITSSRLWRTGVRLWRWRVGHEFKCCLKRASLIISRLSIIVFVIIDLVIVITGIIFLTLSFS